MDGSIHVLVLALTLTACGASQRAPATPVADRASGKAAYDGKRFAECAQIFETLAAHAPRDLEDLYNAACCHALARDADAAFAALDRAIADGLRDDSALAADADLAALHGDPRWAVVVAGAKANVVRFARERLEREGVAWESPTWSTPFVENLADDAKVAGLSRVWMEVKISFPYFARVPELDWDRTYLDYLPRVRATTSTYDYYKVLQQMVALLRDGHTTISLPHELIEREEAEPPLRLELVENRVFVARVESRALEATGVAAGWEIVKIDGVAVREYADKKRRPYVSSNSPQHVEVLVYEYGLLAGPRERPLTIEFRAQDGTLVTRQLPRDRYARDAALPAFQVTMLPGGIAYVTLRTFSSEQVQADFEKALPAMRASRGVILDVRQNDGGSGVVAYNVLGHLVAADFAVPTWKSREYVATSRAWGIRGGGWYEAKPATWKASADVYAGPVVLLTGPRAISATDVFAETFQRLGRGKLVGEPTGGTTGDPLGFPLPGGGTARVSTSANTSTDLVGKGVIPDVLVRRTVRDLLSGRDAALDAAIAVLR